MIVKVIVCLLLCFVTMADPCDQKNFSDCINVVGASCRYIETMGRCFPSKSTDLGCQIGLNRNHCITQQQQCAFVTSCLPVTQKMLEHLTCTNRLLTKSACINLRNVACAWDGKDGQCISYDMEPQGGVCLGSYKQEYVSPLLCSRIPYDICWHNGESCQNASQILSTALCSQPGLSETACRRIITTNEKCIFDKVCRTVQEQEIPLLKCSDAINKATCLILQSEACSWENSKCNKDTKLNVDCTQITDANDLTCSKAQGQCIFNAAKSKCVKAVLTYVTCDTVGLSQDACMSLPQSCIIIEGRCRTMVSPQQQVCSGSGILNKPACLSITTIGQICHWDGKNCLDYSAKIDQDTVCLSLKDVNGNACQSVVNGTCKYDSKLGNCEETNEGDKCTTEFINLKGCIFVTKADQACQWQQSKCQPKYVVPGGTKCNELSNANAIACSQVDTKNDTDFTCLFDPDLQGCRHFRKGEADTMLCGIISKGLNRYACALVTTKGQACHFTQRQCVAYPIQSVGLSCVILIYANAQTCALSTYEYNICKHDPEFFSCTPYLNIQTIGCNEIGLNPYGCMAVVKEKCQYNKLAGKCEPFNQVQNVNPTCEDNLPNKDLCLKLTTIGQYCVWQSKVSICSLFSPDATKTCDMYRSVNPNVCTVVELFEPEKNNGEGFCIHNRETSDCEKLKPDYSCPQNDPCCSEVLGVNIHVCSGRTVPNIYCYFANTRCTRYQHFGAPPNQMILLAEQDYARRKLICKVVNYSGCGILNYDPNLLCYMSNSRDICRQYSEKEFNDVKDYTIFAAANVKANKWICRKVTATNVFMAYDTILSKCKVLTREIKIKCDEPNINQEACRNLTTEDYCVWVPETLTCNIIPDDELKNYGCDTLINETACVEKQGQCMYNRTLGKCQTMAILDPNRDCTYSASGQLTYSPEICTKITKTGQACSYNFHTLQCQTQVIIQSTCENIGFNISSCLGYTFALCQWDAVNNKCIAIPQVQLDSLNCTDNINKSACLKSKTKSCFWDEGAIKCQPENYNTATTCQSLIDSKKQFSVKACTQITYPGSICSYDEANMICTNTGFTTSERCDIIANIHLCLGNTQYSYCQYDSTTNVCSNFINSRNDLKCSEYPNINRDVCVQKTGERCRFDLRKSLCELLTPFSNTTKCSDLFANTNYLYSRQLCIAVSEDVKIVLEPSKITYCKVKTACKNEMYCQFSSAEQGCSYVDFGEETYLNGDCFVEQKQILTCDSNLSRAACLHLTSVQCTFNLSKGGCIPMDNLETSTVTQCQDVNASGCLGITTPNLFCYLKTVDVKIACNIPMVSYQVCRELDNTIKSICDLLYELSVNASVCAATTTGYCNYDHRTNKCVPRVGKTQVSKNCLIEGLSKQACDQSYCEYTNNHCQSKDNNVLPECTQYYLIQPNFNEITQETIVFQSEDVQQWHEIDCTTINTTCGWILDLTNNPEEYDAAACQQCYKDSLTEYTNNLAACENLKTQQYSACVTLTGQSSFDSCNINCATNQTQCIQDCIAVSDACVYDCLSKVCGYHVCWDANTEVCQPKCRSVGSECTQSCNCWMASDAENITCKEWTIRAKNISDELCKKNTKACQPKHLQCQTVNTNDCSTIKSNYYYVSQSTCLTSIGSDCIFTSDSQCTSLPSPDSDAYKQISCYNINKTACLNNYIQQRCSWVQEICKVESINNLKIYKECTTVNAFACLYVGIPCQIINNYCQPVDLSITCAELGSTSIVLIYIGNNFNNYLTCSLLVNSQVCYFDANTCIQYTGTDQKFACTQQGLNKLGCLINTKGNCYYDTACKDVLSFIDFDCTLLNYNACLAHPSKPCVWNQNACSNITYSSGTQTCSSFIANSIPSTFVNEISCSKIVESVCIYVGTTCQSAPSITGCTVKGINKDACLLKTTGQCKYQEKCSDVSCNLVERKCVPISDLNQECSPLFNIVQCVSLINQPCIFKNGACSPFTMNCADYTINSALTMLGTSQYTSIICSNINIVGLSLIYDSILKQCKQVTVADLPCNTKLMNKQACLSHTNEFCVYDNTNDQPCTGDSFQVTKQRCLPYLEGNLLTDTCNSNQNWKVCIGIVKASCQFMNNVCSELPANATCASLSTATTLISQFTCQSRTDVACSYDSDNKRCKVVTSNVLTCEEIGLNIVGCLANTTTLLCEWNEITKKCQNGVKQDYKCTDLINVTNCLLVSLPGQQCAFQDNKCQTVNTSSQCISGLNVNAAACTIAANIGCKYDSVTRKCQAADHTENCLFNLTLNEKACYQNLSDNYCHWSNGKCVQPTDFSTLLCQDSVNLKTCTHITNPTQLCQYIKPLDGANYCMNVIPVVKQCNQNININKPDLCIIAIGGPCWYNVDTRSCEILTQVLDVCSENLNEQACYNNVSIKCEFTDRCRIANAATITNCNQAIRMTQCVVLNLLCQWIDEKCQSIEIPSSCVEDMLYITPRVCQGVRTESNSYCFYDYTKLTCLAGIPTSCSAFRELIQCLKVQTMQCRWLDNLDNQCIDYVPTPNMDECQSFKANATKNVCLGVQKRGQKCEFMNEQCQTAKYQQGWPERVNKDGCLGQRLQPCYFQDLKCECPSLLELKKINKSTKCNDNLSYLLCLSIETDGEYCQWIDEVCQSQAAPTAITLLSFSQVSPNFCRLIMDVAVTYSTTSHSCQLLTDLNADCSQPGLNQLSCSKLVMACTWKNQKCEAYVPKTRRLLTINQTQAIVESSVSIAVCKLLTEPVQFQSGNCVLINSQTRCQDQGVNNQACHQITSEPCIWENDACKYYFTLERCLAVPKNVNSLVCSLIDLDSCAYDSTSNKCVVPNLAFADCYTHGLNYRGCTQINGCVFNKGKCMGEPPGRGCSIADYANVNVCSNASNSCVYDPIRLRCSGIMNTESCDQVGLSEMACQILSKCQYNKNLSKCQCKQQILTPCKDIARIETCNQFQHCIHVDTYCRTRNCDDVILPGDTYETMVNACSTMPNCYLVSQIDRKCKLATTCEEVEFNKQYYNSCADIIIQNRPCMTNQQQCITLECSSLNHKECDDYNTYCYWGSSCIDKRCEHIIQYAECSKQHNCFPYIVTGELKCRYINKCSSIEGDQGKDQGKDQKEVDQCNAIQEILGQFKVMAVSPKGVQCGYVDGKCLNSPCRTFGSMEMDCIGKLINNQNVCILDSTYVCQACEEITNSCDCLEHETHCKYDVTTQQCVSITCPAIIDNQQCTLREDCHYENKACFTKCQYHFSQWACTKFGCLWSENSNSCEQCLSTNATTCSNKIETECKADACCGYIQSKCQIQCKKLNMVECKLEQTNTKKCMWNIDTDQCIYQKTPGLRILNDNDNSEQVNAIGSFNSSFKLQQFTVLNSILCTTLVMLGLLFN